MHDGLCQHFLKPHSGFHNLVSYVFYSDAAKFSNNFRLSISDNLLPWEAWILFQSFLRLTVKPQDYRYMTRTTDAMRIFFLIVSPFLSFSHSPLFNIRYVNVD